MSELSRAELNNLISARSASDPAFHSQLLSDPRSVLGEIVGIDIPDTVSITVHEETLTDIHLVLERGNAPLSETDLELVSGGWSGESCYSCI